MMHHAEQPGPKPFDGLPHHLFEGGVIRLVLEKWQACIGPIQDMVNDSASGIA